MNGSGKPGIAIDRTGVADFFAQVGTQVQLRIQSGSGTVVLTTVRYDSMPVVTEDNRFRLAILAGIKFLEIADRRMIPEQMELRDSEGNTLASFDSEIVTFRIRGV